MLTKEMFQNSKRLRRSSSYCSTSYCPARILVEAAEKRDDSTRKRRRLCRGKSTSCKYPQLEESLLEWIKSVRNDRITIDGLAVTFVEIYGHSPEGHFKASNGWITRFFKRSKLCSRAVTSRGQQIPSNARDLTIKFIEECGEAVLKENYPLWGMANMDETPMWFDMPSSRSIDFRGVRTVLSKTTGKEKMRYTVVLAAFADGSKLPPMIIFRVLKNVPKVDFPHGVVLQVSKGGTMTSDIFLFWLSKVWRGRKNSLFCSKAVLIMDQHASHLHAKVQTCLDRQHQTKSIFIPPGMTPLLQQFDVAWNKPFKGQLKWAKKTLYVIGTVAPDLSVPEITDNLS